MSESARQIESHVLLKVRDEQAWTALMQTHQQAVFRLAYLMLGDAHEADDVAQDTFIRAFRAIDSYDPTRPIRPWLLRIASNLARNRRRAWGRFAHALRRFVFQRPEVLAAPSIEQLGVANAQAQRLWQAVRQLPQAAQEMIYLRFFLDLSEAECAETLNIATGTVKSRTSRAVTRLREIVAREFPELGEG